MLCTGCLLVLLLFGCKPSTPPPASEPPALTTGQVQRRVPIADKWPTCFARMPIARH